MQCRERERESRICGAPFGDSLMFGLALAVASWHWPPRRAHMPARYRGGGEITLTAGPRLLVATGSHGRWCSVAWISRTARPCSPLSRDLVCFQEALGFGTLKKERKKEWRMLVAGSGRGITGSRTKVDAEFSARGISRQSGAGQQRTRVWKRRETER